MRSIQSLPKDAFHALARKQFKALAAELGLQKGEYDLRTNKAGPAYLHINLVCVQNHYMRIEDLHNVKKMTTLIRCLIGTSSATPAA